MGRIVTDRDLQLLRAKETWSGVQERHIKHINSSVLKSCFSTKILVLKIPFEFSNILSYCWVLDTDSAEFGDLPNDNI